MLSIMNDKDDPELSAIDNQRRRGARALWVMSRCFDNSEVRTYVATLGVMFEDLIRGVTDPKRDSMRIWGARLPAVLGLECWMNIKDVSRKKAASDAARDYPELEKLIRGRPGPDHGPRDHHSLYLRGLKGSLLSWYDYYVGGRVPVPELQEAFQETRCAIRAANLSREEYRKIGERYFKQAVNLANR